MVQGKVLGWLSICKDYEETHTTNTESFQNGIFQDNKQWDPKRSCTSLISLKSTELGRCNCLWCHWNPDSKPKHANSEGNWVELSRSDSMASAFRILVALLHSSTLVSCKHQPSFQGSPQWWCPLRPLKSMGLGEARNLSKMFYWRLWVIHSSGSQQFIAQGFWYGRPRSWVCRFHFEDLFPHSGMRRF